MRVKCKNRAVNEIENRQDVDVVKKEVMQSLEKKDKGTPA
jgi:hypothetical protein